MYCEEYDVFESFCDYINAGLEEDNDDVTYYNWLRYKHLNPECNYGRLSLPIKGSFVPAPLI